MGFLLKLFEVKTLTHAGNMTLRGNGGAMYLYKWGSMNLRRPSRPPTAIPLR